MVRVGPAWLPQIRPDTLWAWIMVGPITVGLAIFNLWPVVRTMYYSLTEWGPFGNSRWVGLANYATLTKDADVLAALRNSALYTAIVLVAIPIAIGIASLLNQRGLRGVTIYRLLFFLPTVTLPAAVAVVWRLLYNGEYGIINVLLSLVGIRGPFWLSDSATVMPAIGIVGIWMVLGQQIIIFLAGLQGIPRELYSAAALDGASGLQQFRHITLPLISPAAFFVSVISIIGTMQMFDLMFVMVDGNNPALPHAQTIVYIFYEKAFIENSKGYAAAVAVMLFVVILLLTLVQFRLQRRWVHYA